MLDNGQFIMVELHENISHLQEVPAKVVDNMADGSIPVNKTDSLMDDEVVTVTFDYLDK